jgi:hypothetical protein
MHWTAVACCAFGVASARDIILPPSLELHRDTYQVAIGGNAAAYNAGEDEIYAGLTTFANLPWLHCLSKEKDISNYGESPVDSEQTVVY